MIELRSDPEHDAVCISAARHQLVVAPPGTGKTCLSVRLAGKLSPTLAEGARVLLLTFSTQARTQLEREAARQLKLEVRKRVEITNYHRFFWHAVRAYRRALGLPMRLDLGSRQRRESALQAADGNLVRELKRKEGLIESLAEHAFPDFRDTRTPDEQALYRLLVAVDQEQRAGRIVFDDLGALFWTLLERFPAVEQAYLARYPIVIADEHQDASALQDAVVRRLGRERLCVYADPMQLIHGFRGADPQRLERHSAECGERLTLTTPHRWHGNELVAEWLLAVRARLEGHKRPGAAPPELHIEYTPANYSFNPMKQKIRIGVSRAFRAGAQTVAVLARSNREVAQIRNYLMTQGLRPRQIGGEDFEEARVDIEQLPLLQDSHSIALHALERLEKLAPSVSSATIEQVKRRLGPTEISFQRVGEEAAGILTAFEMVYRDGPARYFEAIGAALDACKLRGHHLPRDEAVRALRVTAEAHKEQLPDLERILDDYSDRVAAASHVATLASSGLLVMTVHQSKGKEFDAVILSNASERSFPDDEETRRLFYVAITRASKSWRVVAPRPNESPLLKYLLGD